MPRITITEELDSELKEIRSGEGSLRYKRGLDDVVAFLVQDYKTRKTVREQLELFRREIGSTVKENTREGVKEAMKKLFEKILALVRT